MLQLHPMPVSARMLACYRCACLLRGLCGALRCHIVPPGGARFVAHGRYPASTAVSRKCV